MANAIHGSFSSSYPNFGANRPSNLEGARALYHFSVTPQSGVHGDARMTSFTAQPFEASSFGPDRSVSELATRRLLKEVEQAKHELHELEDNLAREMTAPSLREWLFPLMAIGLVLSLIGSFSAANIAELGATGLMLLWSLSAFWFIYTGDKRLERAKEAHKAEIEIWSSRVEELERTLQTNLRVAEARQE